MSSHRNRATACPLEAHAAEAFEHMDHSQPHWLGTNARHAYLHGRERVAPPFACALARHSTIELRQHLERPPPGARRNPALFQDWEQYQRAAAGAVLAAKHKACFVHELKAKRVQHAGHMVREIATPERLYVGLGQGGSLT